MHVNYNDDGDDGDGTCNSAQACFILNGAAAISAAGFPKVGNAGINPPP